ITFAALGGRSRFWTALGPAPAARLAASDLAGAGVEVVDVAPPGFELAVSTVLLDAATGERAVVSGSGNVPAFGKIAGPDLSGVDVVLVDGHHAPLARSAVLAAGEGKVPGRARADRGSGVAGGGGTTPVVVDAGSHKPVLDDILPFVTDVICSADYVHPGGLGPADLLGLGPELVAVSHGGDPLEWWTHSSRGTIAPTAMDVVDTVGAGDVLHGAYCHGLASGMARLEALEAAVALATERVRHLGPFAWRGSLAQG
ncbi:PfkB family carbohydrate kinase, partial [Propionicimonas sp.]|uniref:PfkB family carbohydrate kinase n=1 Tax=Propionicimonas sp. TaxID=1955623 RepID=UPI0039E65606